jgi:Icc-related predicted phosphoesterase
LPIAALMPTSRHKKSSVRIAAVGDLHCTRTSQGTLQPIFAEAMDRADVLVLCGDLTDYGLPEEAHVLARELGAAKMPIVGVLGNHDYESGHADEVKAILCDAGVAILDGDAVELEGVGFAGAKGFAGGFGRRTLGPWGEDAIKAFVQEGMNEALKLESALARLRTPHRVAVLHYSPIRDTVVGEPEEIFCFLGTSRLEEPLNRYPLSLVFHGHAHRGTAQGATTSGVPVHNVALPLLRALKDGPPVKVVELSLDEALAA